MDEKPRSKNMGLGLAVGVAIGMALGAAMDSMGVGLAFGIAIGIALGGSGAFGSRKKVGSDDTGGGAGADDEASDRAG